MNITNQELISIIGEQTVKIKILESQIYQMQQQQAQEDIQPQTENRSKE